MSFPGLYVGRLIGKLSSWGRKRWKRQMGKIWLDFDLSLRRCIVGVWSLMGNGGLTQWPWKSIGSLQLASVSLCSKQTEDRGNRKTKLITKLQNAHLSWALRRCNYLSRLVERQNSDVSLKGNDLNKQTNKPTQIMHSGELHGVVCKGWGLKAWSCLLQSCLNLSLKAM